MGLFDKFKDYRKNRDDKRIERGLASIKNPKAMKEDRAAAIEFFKDLGDVEAAVPALCQRFEYSLEHGINDTREKESTMQAIEAYGQAAIPYVRQHLQSTNRIAWPIKVLKALGEEQEVIEILKGALDFGDIAFDQARVDKNYDILCYLRDYKVPGFTDRLAHFLNDPDERVRFAATELLVEQDDPKVPLLLERFIGDASADNTRIRQAVVEAFLRNQWVVKDLSPYPEGRVVDHLFVNQAGHLEIRP